MSQNPTLVDTITGGGSDSSANKIAELERRIADLEEWQGFHIGLVPGAQQVNAPHPYQQIATAEFGGGAMQVSPIGLLVKLGDNVTTTFIGFVPEFADTLPLAMPNAQLAAYISRTYQITQCVLSTDYSTNYNASLTLATNAQSVSYWQLVANDLTAGGGTPSANFSGQVLDSGESYLEASVPLKFAVLASDPASLQDGEIWYNSTSKTFKARQNGLTKTVTVA